jgi:transposase-like protein
MDEMMSCSFVGILRYSLRYRDLEEIMAERGVSVEVLRYAPILNERLRRHLRRPGASWRVDETYIRVKDVWTYLYRAIDSTGDTLISYYR